MLRGLSLFFALATTSLVWAQNNAASPIRDALAALNAEQQAIYQQFQMLQTLRSQSANGYIAMPPQPGPPPNYEDVVAEKQAAADSAKRYQSDMDALYNRYRELEEQKQPLLLQLRQLALEPPAPPSPATNRAPASVTTPRPN